MSDRIAVMSQGRVEQVGAPEGGLRGAGHRLRRRLPGRLEPDGRRREGRDPGRLPACSSATSSCRRQGRGGHHRSREDRDPSRARGTCSGRRRPGRTGPGHGRARGLRRLDHAGPREPRERRSDPGLGAQRRQARPVPVRAPPSPCSCRATRCGCCPTPARRSSRTPSSTSVARPRLPCGAAAP